MPIPVAETPPAGLDAYWLGVWRCALKTLKEQGSWDWTQKPLLDQYVFALIDAEQAREDDADTRWDRAAKRAMSLADLLALTPRGRKAANIGVNDEDTGDELDALDAPDELARRRGARSA